MEDVRINPAEEAELDLIEALLRDCGLPTEGLASHWQFLYLARIGGEIAGCAAIEIYGHAGLLRSVAVQAGYRGRGLGDQLTRRVLQVAVRAGFHKYIY